MIVDYIFLVIAVFFVLGGIDYLLGSRFGIGEEFEKGIKLIGTLGLNMIGIFILAPLMTDYILKATEPVANLLGIDPSILPASILAIDMGGFQMGTLLANNEAVGMFSGIILSASFGAVFSFSIPVALGMINNDTLAEFLQGMVIGLICIPIGAIVGGLVQGISIGVLMANMLPLVILTAILGAFIVWKPKVITKCFGVLSKLIVLFSVLGLIIAGVSSIVGIEIPGVNISEAAVVVVQIGFFIAGAYPMLKVCSKIFYKPLMKLGKVLDVDEHTIVGLIGNLVSNLLLFSQFDKMSSKGKVMAAAAAISGAFVFGGQLGFVNIVAGDMVEPFIVSKLVAGFLSVGIAYIYCSSRGKRKAQDNK